MKARKFFAFVAGAAMLFAGWGCTPNEEGEGATSEPLVYELSQNSMALLSSEEKTATVELTSNGSWRVVVPEEHSDIVVTPLSGKGNATVTVTVPAYEGDRIATLLFNFSKKTTYPGVGVIEEDEDLTFTISQNAAGVATTQIANLVAGESVTISGLIGAKGSKASILTDATGSVVLYGVTSHEVGTRLMVTGKPFHHQGYKTNALQFDPKASDGPAQIEVLSTGNTVAYNPQVLTGEAVDKLVGNDVVCSEVQFEGTVVIGQYANVSIEGASKQASLYYVNVADYKIYDGVKVVVKGYVTGTYNYLNVLPYSVETTETIISCADITSVSAAGVTAATATFRTLNVTGAVSVSCDGEVVEEASVDGNTLTYTVNPNSGEEGRDGWIKLSADGVEKTVKVSQLGSKPEAYPYAESFATSQGKFTIENVSLAEGISYVWSYDATNKYMKGSAYYNNAAYAAESWLVSPKINMTGATTPVLTFTHLVNKLDAGTPAECFTVNVKESTATEWTVLEIPQHGKNDGWNWVESGEIDLSAYVGKTIQIGFKYTSTAEAAGTWEVKNVKVAEKGSTDVPVVPGDYDFISDAAFICSADNSSFKQYKAEGLINGSTVVNAKGFKLGNSSTAGYFASQPVAVEGDVTLEFYAVAWSGKSATLYVRKKGSTDLIGEFELNANSGATGNVSEYTMNLANDSYYSVSVTGVTANTVLEFATDPSFAATASSKSRAIVFGVHIVGGTPSTPTTPEPEQPTPDTPEVTETITGLSHIENLDGLTAGKYYFAAYSTKNSSDEVFANFPYHLWTGTVTSGKADTANYAFADGVLSRDPNHTSTAPTTEVAVEAELVAVEGKTNVYYIKFNDNYLSVSGYTANHKLEMSATALEWTAVEHTDGVVFQATDGAGSVTLCTGTAANDLLRQYKTSSFTSSLTSSQPYNGVHLFKKN